MWAPVLFVVCNADIVAVEVLASSGDLLRWLVSAQ